MPVAIKGTKNHYQRSKTTILIFTIDCLLQLHSGCQEALRGGKNKAIVIGQNICRADNEGLFVLYPLM